MRGPRRELECVGGPLDGFTLPIPGGCREAVVPWQQDGPRERPVLYRRGTWRAPRTAKAHEVLLYAGEAV